MTRSFLLAIAWVCCALMGCVSAPPDPRAMLAESTSPLPLPLPLPLPPSFAPALRTAMPSVVGVYGIDQDRAAVLEMLESPRSGQNPLPMEEQAPWSTPEMPVSVGAGFFIDVDGTLVTAAHVVAGAKQVLVKLPDQQVVLANVLARDSELDIAVLKAEGVTVSSPRFGRSFASRPGDWVLAVGEPYALRRSVVAGIVSGPARHFAEDREGFFIQSNLSLNPGNSGGPLLNASGAIIGMNLRMVVGPFGAGGVSLSIPIEIVLQIARELTSGEGARRPRLGAAFEDVTPSVARGAARSYATGALITFVNSGSNAERLGLRRGDIVTGINGWAIEDSADLARRLLAWQLLAGTQLVVWRDGRYQALELR